MSEQKRNAPEASVELLQLISEPLRVELHFEIHASVLMKHPFFDCYYAVNAVGIQKLCHQAAANVSISNGDVLFCDLESPGEQPQVYFLVSGQLEYMHHGMCFERVEPGHWAGEAV